MQVFNRNGATMMVTVDTAKCLDALRKNLEIHTRQFEEAKRGYFDLAAKELRAALREHNKNVKAGKLESISVHQQPPSSCARAYVTAIRMLEAHTEPTIELSSDQVNSFLHNEWDWSREFHRTYVAYSAAANLGEVVGATGD